MIGLRQKRGRFVSAVSGLVAIAMIVPMTYGPAASAATPSNPSSTPASSNASCANPPSYATISTASCNHFVALWSPRLTDKAWFNNYVNLAAVPPDIQAEGYHSLDKPTQGWLVAALVQSLVKTQGYNGMPAGSTPAAADLQKTEGLVALLVFGKDQINQFKANANKPAVPNANKGPAPSILQGKVDALAHTPVTSNTTPAPQGTAAPTTTQNKDLLHSGTDGILNNLMSPKSPSAPVSPPKQNAPPAATAPLDPNNLIALVIGVLSAPALQSLLTIITDLLNAVSNVEQLLFSIPGVNIIGGLTYRVCAESATLALSCTVNLPVGIPIPVAATGNHVPDVLATLAPAIPVPTVQVVSLIPLVVHIVVDVADLGVTFEVARLTPGLGPLPAHVFAVYDPPLTNKRIEYGYDGRASTLADDSKTTLLIRNAFAAINGNVELLASITHRNPGSNEAETFALKGLQTHFGSPPTVQDPIAGAVRFTPVPTSINSDVHLQHNGKDEDTVTLDSNQPSTVTAGITQDVTSSLPASHREFSALIDQLPTHVSVDLLHQDPQQIITYGANAVISHVHVTQKSINDVTQPGSFTQNDADVLGLPSAVTLTLTGASDVLYQASSVVPQVQFVTQTQLASVLQSEIAATAHGLPQNIHLNNATAPDGTTVTYDADSSLTDIAVGIFDLANDRTVIDALAQSLPLHAKLAQTKSTGATDYTSSGPIGLIKATLSRAGGLTIPLPGVDHVTVLKSGAGLGVDAQISGVVAAHADPSSNASYSLTMSPGGQEFKGLAVIDAPNRIAQVDISNLPSDIAVTIDPANGKATYAASAIINKVVGSYQQVDIGQIADITLVSIPKNITATWQTGGSTPSITYQADSRLGSLTAFYQQAPGATTFLGQVSDLPLFMQVKGLDPITFDARTAPSSAQASDHVGQISLRYASNGTLVTTGDPNDHLFLGTTSGTKAELVYSGLEFFSVDTTNQQVHAEVMNTAPRLFDVALLTPTITANGFIDKVPADVKVDMVGQDIQYHASSSINEIAASVTRASGDVINADVTSLPQAIDLFFDSANSIVTWNALGVTGGITAQATFVPATTGNGRTVNASLVISSIPAQWDARYASGHLLFEGVSGAIGLIQAIFTNHGVATVFGQDGVSVDFNQGTGDLDAFLQISQLTRAEFQKVAPSGGGAGGYDANLNMGTGIGENFAINAQVATTDGTLINVTGSFLNLPTQMHLRSVDGLISYTGNLNPTLTLDAQYGNATAVASLPNPSFVHGIVVRDAAGGGGKALRAKLFITGLPTGLTFDTIGGIYNVTGFNPTQDPLKLDVALNNFVSPPVSLVATQFIGLGSPVSFVFGPMTTGVGGGGEKLIHVQYTANRGMGAFDALATVGTNVAQVHISNIPSSVVIDTSFGADTKTININLGNVITDIKANYKRTSDVSFVAGAELTNVPTTVALTIGKQDGGQGVATPIFSMHNSAAGMGLTAFVDASAFSSSLNAFVQVTATNLGKDITSGLSGTTLSLASSPATGSFTLVATAKFTFTFDISFTAGPFENHGNVGINLNVTQFTVGFTDMSSLVLKLGYSTAIEGSYGTFTFGEQSDTHIDVHDHLDLNLGIGTISNVVQVNINNLDLGNVIGNFRMADNVLGDWMSFFTGIPCFPLPPLFFFIDIQLRPHPRFTTSGSTFTVSSSDTEGSGVWIATVNPLGIVPDFVSDIIARFASPDGGDQHVGVSCGI